MMNALNKHRNDVLDEIKAAQKLQEEQMSLRLDEVASGLALLGENFSGSQDLYDRLQRSLNRPSGRGRDDEIVVMLSEKLSYDYIEKALQSLKDRDYANAASGFNMALKYQQRNRTLMFYETYSLYLQQINRGMTESELTEAEARVKELKGLAFREQERVDLSIKEMEQILDDMLYNIAEMKRQNEQKSVRLWETEPAAGNIMDEGNRQEIEEEHHELLQGMGAG
jgi:hypothetical protein